MASKERKLVQQTKNQMDSQSQKKKDLTDYQKNTGIYSNIVKNFKQELGDLGAVENYL